MSILAKKNSADLSIDNGNLPTMKASLEETKSQLEKEIKSQRKQEKENTAVAESWLARFWTARKSMVEAKDKPEALEAISILAAQAKQYAIAYAKLATSHQEKLPALEEQLSKISEAIVKIETLEKTSLLNQQLRRISSTVDMTGIQEATHEIDNREVSLLIHTATALIELNADKVKL